ncbi:MAG: hypothetical protein ACPGU1_14315 [Myxococcota bacterium]
MTQGPSLILSASLLSLLAFASPTLACMDHEEMFVPMDEGAQAQDEPATPPPISEAPGPYDFPCDTDMDCPASLTCEHVECCMARDCLCPPMACLTSDTGAQGRDCLSDDDCGSDYSCTFDDGEGCTDQADEVCVAPRFGWCDFDPSGPPSAMPYPDDGADALDEGTEELTGCQGGSDTGLPLVFALALFAATLSRRPQLS